MIKVTKEPCCPHRFLWQWSSVSCLGSFTRMIEFLLPLLFSRKEFGIWGVGVVTIQCVLAFRYRQQSQEMGKAVPRMRWRACWACEHKLWVSVHSPVGRVCRNGMRKRASRLWRRYLCHCPITSFPFMSYPDRQMAGPQVGTLASVSVLCSSYSLCFSLRRL